MFRAPAATPISSSFDSPPHYLRFRFRFCFCLYFPFVCVFDFLRRRRTLQHFICISLFPRPLQQHISSTPATVSCASPGLPPVVRQLHVLTPALASSRDAASSLSQEVSRRLPKVQKQKDKGSLGLHLHLPPHPPPPPRTLSLIQQLSPNISRCSQAACDANPNNQFSATKSTHDVVTAPNMASNATLAIPPSSKNLRLLLPRPPTSPVPRLPPRAHMLPKALRRIRRLSCPPQRHCHPPRRRRTSRPLRNVR